MRALRMRWRRFKRANRWVFWAAIAVAGISFWVGMERGYSCVDSEGIELFETRPDCICERDGVSRWRYGRCDLDPVEWSAADLALIVALDRRDDEAGRPHLELDVRNVLRGGARKGDRISLKGGDAWRLLAEISNHPHGAADETFIVMLHAWGPGVGGWQFPDGGYYPIGVGAEARPETVFLSDRDIQLFHAKSGSAYSAPPTSAPFRDFMYSLWLEWPAK